MGKVTVEKRLAKAAKREEAHKQKTESKKEKGTDAFATEISDIGEIVPDSSGKTSYKVRIIKRNSDNVLLTDVRQFISNPDPSKYSGFTGKGISLADADSIAELIDLLTAAHEEFTELTSTKKAKKKAKKK